MVRANCHFATHFTFIKEDLTKLNARLVRQRGVKSDAFLVNTAPLFPPVAFPQAPSDEAFAYHGAVERDIFLVRNNPDLKTSDSMGAQLRKD